MKEKSIVETRCDRAFLFHCPISAYYWIIKSNQPIRLFIIGLNVSRRGRKIIFFVSTLWEISTLICLTRLLLIVIKICYRRRYSYLSYRSSLVKIYMMWMYQKFKRIIKIQILWIFYYFLCFQKQCFQFYILVFVVYRTDETTSYILINKDYYIIYIIIHNIWYSLINLFIIYMYLIISKMY